MNRTNTSDSSSRMSAAETGEGVGHPSILPAPTLPCRAGGRRTEEPWLNRGSGNMRVVAFHLMLLGCVVLSTPARAEAPEAPMTADGLHPLASGGLTFGPDPPYWLAPYVATAVGNNPVAVAIGDVTGDSRGDVVLVTNSGAGFDPASAYSVFVFPQLDDGTLDAPAQYAYLGGGPESALLLTDLNGDGVTDVVAGHSSGISILLADGAGGLLSPVVVTDGDAYRLAAMDVDLDGNIDVISLGWSRGASVLYGDGAGGVSSITLLPTNASGFNDMAEGDVTGDGVADLVVMNGNSPPTLSVHIHDGIGTFLAPPMTQTLGADHTRAVGLGDVSGDGLHDVVLTRSDDSPGWLWVFLQDGAGGLAPPFSLDTLDNADAIDVTDVDGDAREDIAVVHGGLSKLGLYLQDAAGSFGPEVLFDLPYSYSYSGQALAIGDLSSDDCTDVAIVDRDDGLVVLYGQCPVDSDADGHLDPFDNCAGVPNPTQADADTDGVGDGCDQCPAVPDASQADVDGDRIGDACDVCPSVPNPEQQDRDDDGAGDACDPCPDVQDTLQADSDGDGVGDGCDTCPTAGDPDQADRDADEVGDACDVCPDVPNPSQEDTDQDSHGDACDACPLSADPQQFDRDGDGAGDECDLCPDDPTPSQDADGDGVGTTCDNCPLVAGSLSNAGCPAPGCGCSANHRQRQVPAPLGLMLLAGLWFVVHPRARRG